MKLVNQRTLVEGSLFSGYDGCGLALKEMGLRTETAWYCDPDPGAAALLAYHYPDVPNLGDIMRVGLDIPDDEWKAMLKRAKEYPAFVLPEPDWSGVRPIDILTGGFPCQDISNAGKREGITGARSALWKYYVRAIRALRPRLIFVENVAVLRTRGLEVVLADLAELGFDAEWCTLTASAVGAPHVRNRFFLVAQDAQRESRDQRRLTAPGQTQGRWTRADAGGRGGMAVADPARPGHQGVGGQPEPAGRVELADGRGTAATDAACERAYGPGSPEGALGGQLADGGGQAFADADGEHLRQQPGWRGGTNGSGAAVIGRGGSSALDWREYESGIRRWESVLGRPAPEPTVPGARRSHVLSPHLTEWMMGLPEGWIAGVPELTRNQQIKLAGNGVVKQQAAYAFVRLLERLAT